MQRISFRRCNNTSTLHTPSLCPLRTFFTTPIASKSSPLPPRPTVATSDLYKTYLKGSGPGGQKINKTSSAVQLTHLPTGIVVKSQETRSRSQNEKIARRILAEKVEVSEKGSEARVLVKQARESKKKRSGEKKRRRKYRKLEEEKEGSNMEVRDGDEFEMQEGLEREIGEALVEEHSDGSIKQQKS